VKSKDVFVFHHDAFNRASARQVVYNDGRAVAGGKLWDDVWQIPRLVENSKERITGFPTQLPLALVEPIIKGCSDPGDLVFDPFTGSGTTAVAAVLNGRKFLGTEINPKYADLARLRVRAAIAGMSP
jgi:DNA modification methylase